MKRFQFRPDPLLRYREYMEHKARLDVSAVLNELRMCDETIRALQEKVQRAAARLDKMTGEGIERGRLIRYTEYLASLAMEIDMEEHRKKKLQSDLVDRQKILKKRSIEKSALENLKERRQTEYYDEMIKEIQEESDDMVLIRRTGAVDRG